MLHSRDEGEVLKSRIAREGDGLTLDPPGIEVAVSDFFAGLDGAFADWKGRVGSGAETRLSALRICFTAKEEVGLRTRLKSEVRTGLSTPPQPFSVQRQASATAAACPQ